MADSCEWIFYLFGRHHCKSRIFERMENFQNDCCRPWTEKPFKNSYSRQLRIVNAVVSWSPAGQLFFSKLKLLILRQWWQLWMKSTEIKQRYRINCFSQCFACPFYSVLNSISKLIHNRCTCMLIIKTLGLPVAAYVYANDQLCLCFYVLIRFSLLFSSVIILKQLFPSGSVNIVE